ncbi:hypothetical protein B0H11DRAFT_2207949 [Mycena galericulata]|nr:hypothetical protein B0H11DRAFT_2207949 [Mycena galericulata]
MELHLLHPCLGMNILVCLFVERSKSPTFIRKLQMEVASALSVLGRDDDRRQFQEAFKLSLVQVPTSTGATSDSDNIWHSDRVNASKTAPDTPNGHGCCASIGAPGSPRFSLEMGPWVNFVLFNPDPVAAEQRPSQTLFSIPHPACPLCWACSSVDIAGARSTHLVWRLAAAHEHEAPIDRESRMNTLPQCCSALGTLRMYQILQVL